MVKHKKLAGYIGILLVLSYIFLFSGLGAYSLKEPDEGRYAEIPREMVESGDYTVPRLNDVRYFEKPPLLYWAVSLSYKVFGVSECSFRFPNALAAMLCVFSIFFFVRRWADDLAAFLGSLVLLSSFGFFAMARIVTTDMVLTFWLFLSLLCFYAYYRERSTPFLWGFYAAMALATLTKGPVAPVLLCATLFIFLLMEGNLAFIKEMKLVRGVALYCIVAAPWFIIISIREKEFLNFFFIDQHFLRFISTKHRRSGPIYYFLPVILVGMFPWSLYIPRAFAMAWKRSDCRLFAIWSTLVFLFFSVSGSKLTPYILPVFPALSMLVGVLFYENRRSPFAHPWEIIANCIIMAAFALAFFLYLSPSFMTYIDDIAMEALSIARDLIYFSLAVSLTSAICFILFLFKPFRLPKNVFAVLFLFSLSILIAIVAHSGVIDRAKTAKALATAAKAQSNKPDIIINYSALNLTLPFYLQKPVVIASYTGELAMGSKYEDSKKYFMDENEFLDTLGSGKKVLFVTKYKRIDNLRKQFPGRIKILKCQNDRCLLSNY
ncbi:MAG: arnT [Deltaproteobacteria bacterium]|nr:arnT [Deltaproteobacteria bacterium]